MTAVLVAAAAILVPLVVVPGSKESFRIPKEAVFAAFAALIGGTLALRALWSKRWRVPEPPLRRLLGSLAALALWTGISTATSTHRLLSLASVALALGTLLFALGVFSIAEAKRRWIFPLLLIPALANSLLALSQRFSAWSPFTLAPEVAGTRIGVVGFLGNANDLAGYLEAVGLSILPIQATHVIVTADREPDTRDPFDRLLLAQCHVEGSRLLTFDRLLLRHPLVLSIP